MCCSQAAERTPPPPPFSLPSFCTTQHKLYSIQMCSDGNRFSWGSLLVIFQKLTLVWALRLISVKQKLSNRFLCVTHFLPQSEFKQRSVYVSSDECMVCLSIKLRRRMMLRGPCMRLYVLHWLWFFYFLFIFCAYSRCCITVVHRASHLSH